MTAENNEFEEPETGLAKLGKLMRQFSETGALKAVIAPSADKKAEVSASSATFAAVPEEVSSLSSVLMGPISGLGEFYFPPELIGGCCPRVLGEEQDVVWQAAAEAADTERVHVVWQASGDKIWYLAVRSSELSAHANTWCPFASLLPGMKDSLPAPTCYTYFSDEAATMMTVMTDGLQIHRGTSSVVRAKAERMARELDGAPIIELVPDRIQKLTPIPWFSLSLFEERARRVLAVLAVVGALAFTAICIVVWFFAAMAAMSAHTDRDAIVARSQDKSLQLMRSVQNLRASPMREQLAKFSEINDGLLALNGFLDMYQVKGTKALWRAVLPSNVTSDRISELGGQTLDSTDDGVVIGNSREALSMGKK